MVVVSADAVRHLDIFRSIDLKRNILQVSGNVIKDMLNNTFDLADQSYAFKEFPFLIHDQGSRRHLI